MSFDYSMLVAIAENSGRETFITDENFNILWTNSETTLTANLLRSNARGISDLPDKENVISCTDGILKILPIIKDSQKLGYFIEKYESAGLLSMLSGTDFFEDFSEQYNALRREMADSVKDLCFRYGDRNNYERLKQYLANSANMAAMLKVMSFKKDPGQIDLYRSASFCCDVFKVMLEGKKNVKFSFDLRPGLYAKVHRAAYEYALMNLLLNAYMYSYAPGNNKREMTLTAYNENDLNYTIVTDSGKSVRAKQLEKYKNPAFSARKEKDKGEGLGIAFVAAFAEKYHGSFNYEEAKDGGIKAVLTLPYDKNASNLVFMTPFGDERNRENFWDIVNKCATADDVKRIKDHLYKYRGEY